MKSHPKVKGQGGLKACSLSSGLYPGLLILEFAGREEEEEGGKRKREGGIEGGKRRREEGKEGGKEEAAIH